MKELLDDVSITRSLKRMAHEIVEKNKGCDHLVLVSIKIRGEFLAKGICDYIYDFENDRIYEKDIQFPFEQLYKQPFRGQKTCLFPFFYLFVLLLSGY